MPYIKKQDRERIAGGGVPESIGDLTYVVYKEAVEYFRRSEGRYADISEVVAALDNAKTEFYLQHAAPYEAIKREENGDV